jgi:hypothetical protein
MGRSLIHLPSLTRKRCADIAVSGVLQRLASFKGCALLARAA